MHDRSFEDEVTPEYEGELDSFGSEWQFFFDSYCTHGYYRGIECPDCDTSHPVAIFDGDPGDENDYTELH